MGEGTDWGKRGVDGKLTEDGCCGAGVHATGYQRAIGNSGLTISIFAWFLLALFCGGRLTLADCMWPISPFRSSRSSKCSMDLVETENFGYKLATEEEGIRIFDDALAPSELQTDYLDLLDLSSSGFVVCSNTKDVVLDKILVIERQDKPQTVSGFTRVTQVAFSYDQSQLYVVDDGILLAMPSDNFHTPTRDSFKRQLELDGITSIRPSRQHNGILVLTNDKTLYLLQGSRHRKVVDGVSAFSWASPEDKVITADGNTISFVSPTGKVSATKQADDGLEAVSVISLGDKKILASFSDQEEDLQSFALDLTSQSLEPVDISPAYAGTERRSVYYSRLVHQWIPDKSISFVISSKATAIDTIIHDDLQASLVEQINETERAQMPLDEEGEDATAVGLAVDLSHDKTKVSEVSSSVEEAIGVLPKLWCLTSMGTLVGWWVFAAHEVKENTLSLQRAQKAIVRLPLSLDSSPVEEPQKPSTESAPASTQKSQPAETGANSGVGGTGFGSSGFGSSATGNGSGNTTSGNTSFGNTGFGSSGFGSTASGNSGFGSTGFGNTGFGNSGFGSSFGNTSLGSTGFGALQASPSGFGQTAFSSAKKNTDTTKTTGSTSSSSNFAKFAGTTSSFANIGGNKESPFGSTNSNKLIFGEEKKGEQPLIFGGQKLIFGDKKVDETKLIFGKSEEQKLIFGAPTLNQEEQKLIFGAPALNQEEKKLIFGAPALKQEEKKLIFGAPALNQEEKKLIFGAPALNQEEKKLLFADQKLPFGLSAASSKSSSVSDLPFARLSLGSLEKPKAQSPFEQLGLFKSGALGAKKEESPFAKLNDKTDSLGDSADLGKESSPFPEISSLSVDSKKDATLSPFGKLFHTRQQSESKPAFSFDAEKPVVLSSEAETSENDSSEDQESESDTDEQPRLAGLNPSGVESRKFKLDGETEEQPRSERQSPQTDNENDEEWETVETPDRDGVEGEDEDEEDEASEEEEEAAEEAQDEAGEEVEEGEEANDLINEYEVVEKSEADGYIDVPVDVELLSYGGLASNVGSEQSISGMVSKIYQETSGHLEILRENEMIMGNFIGAHSHENQDVSLEEPTQWTLGLASALKDKIGDVPEIAATNRAEFGRLDERLTKLQSQVRATQKLRIPLEKQLAQLKLLTENLQSFSADSRPLDSRSQMMRDQLRRKVKSVQETYNEALKLLMPLKAQAGTSQDTVKNLERAVVQLSQRINAKQAEVNKLAKDIQAMSLGEPRMIEAKSFNTYDVRRKWHDYYA